MVSARSSPTMKAKPAAPQPTHFAAPQPRARLPSGTVLQRKCACGGNAGSGDVCDKCENEKKLQRKATGADAFRPQHASDEARYEAEADRVADQVLSHSPTAGHSRSPGKLATPAIQRRRVDGGGELDAVPSQVDAALAAPGRPLDAATRQFFEPRFGHDFSRVRVHVDDAATDSVSAHAFTVGERIVFAANQYRPSTDSGKRLLAHELTHVVQQQRGGASGSANERHERDADHAADAALRPGPPAQVHTAMGLSIARQPTGDPRHNKGYAGEQGMGFQHYSEKDGWMFFEGPSGSAGHGVTTPGFDGMAYNPKLDVLDLLDNKALKASGNVSSATAIDPARNLAKNIDAAITRVRAMKDTPNRIRVLDLLGQAKDALANGRPMPSKVRLVVTGVGGNSTGVTAGLQGRGVQFRGASTPPATSPPPTATNAATAVGEESAATPHIGAPIKAPPTIVTRPSLGAAAAADARVEVEIQGALGALANETRSCTRVTTLVKGGVAVFGMTLEAISALSSVNDALDLYTHGTILGEAQQGAQKLRENAARTLAESQARRDAFSAFGNIVLEDKLETNRDLEGLDQLSHSLGELGDTLDPSVESLKSLAKNTRARATASGRLADMLMKAAAVPQGIGTTQQASEFALAQSLELLSGSLSTAASDYEQSLDLLTDLKGYADSIGHKANTAYWRISLKDIAQKLAERERQSAAKPKTAPAAQPRNAHAPSPAYLAPQKPEERDKQINDAMTKPTCPGGGCHQPNRESTLRDRIGDDLFKFDDKQMREWLKQEKPDDKP